MGVPLHTVCLFCKKEITPNNSFKNINPETGEIDYFHMKCFKEALNHMIQEFKERSLCP